MSIANSIRGLSDKSAGELLSKRPANYFTEGLPGTENSWVKRKFLQAKSPKKQDAFEDFSWSIPDLGAGGEW